MISAARRPTPGDAPGGARQRLRRAGLPLGGDARIRSGSCASGGRPAGRLARRRSGADNPAAFRLLVFALLIALVLVLAHGGVGRLAHRARRAAVPDDGAPRAGRATRRDAAWYLREADRAAADGRIAEALQLAFVALALDARRRRACSGTTRARHPAECAREARLAREDRERLRALVRALYAHVFGGRPCARGRLPALARRPSPGPGMHPRAELGARHRARARARGGRRRGRRPPRPRDRRRPAALDLPGRARWARAGYAEALGRLGVRVEPFRRPTAALDTDRAGRAPSSRCSARAAPLDAATRARRSRHSTPISCSRVRGRRGDALSGLRRAAAMAGLPADRSARRAEARPFPRARAVLARRDARPSAVDPSEPTTGARVTCTAPAARTVDTLLRTIGGRPVALRAALRTTAHGHARGRRRAVRQPRAARDRGRPVRARAGRAAVRPHDRGRVPPRLRRVAHAERRDLRLDAPLALGLGRAAARGRRCARAARRRHPVRPGPAGIERRRRSPLEHVRALATALAAARGHDVAVRPHGAGAPAPALARGPGRPRRELDAWLDELGGAVRTPRGREALDTLAHVTAPPRERGRRAAGGRRRGNALGGAHADMTAEPMPLEPDEADRARGGGAHAWSRRSSAWCWASRPRCARRWPRSSRAATCCSRACPAPPRRCWCGRSAWRSASSSAASSSRPDLMPSDITGVSLLTAPGTFSFRPGTDLRRPRAGRRDQPRAGQDPGRAARGDAGAARDRGRHVPRAARGLHRLRDAEPDRVRGHLSAARGGARPLPGEGARRVSRGAGRSRGSSSRVLGGFEADLPPSYGIERVADGAGLARLRDAVRRVRVEPSLVAYITAIVRATRDARRCSRWARRPAAAWRCSRWPRRRRCSTGGRTSCRTT